MINGGESSAVIERCGRVARLYRDRAAMSSSASIAAGLRKIAESYDRRAALQRPDPILRQAKIR